jgi:FkbM family methyltransferase
VPGSGFPLLGNGLLYNSVQQGYYSFRCAMQTCTADFRVRGMQYRRLVEWMTSGLVIRRRLPAAFARAALYVSPAAGLRFLVRPMGSVDPSLLTAAERLVKRGDVVWDIGANVGLFSVAAAVRAGHTGKVFAFEPDLWLVGLLERTSVRQSAELARIAVVPVAVASDISLRSFSIASQSRAWNALTEYGRGQMGGVRKQHLVPAFNLDWLLSTLPMPNLVKIDVEGAELEVLREQSRLLNVVRPVIICEVGSETADEITRLLTAASYCLFDGEKEMVCGQSVHHATWNTVAIPEEKRARYLRDC